MTSSVRLLMTKMHCPRPVEGLIQRGRLLSLLDKSLQCPLTLVSAPPGYGKTALVSSWVYTLSMPAAWLVLDEEESSLAQFLAYFIASLELACSGRFSESKELLASSDLPSLLQIATVLANDIEVVGKDIVLVLDDYHVVDNASDVHELMGRLLEHPPENFHLILITRRDPPFPLIRMRACNHLLDVRMSDLRFRADETKAMFQQSLDRPIGTLAIENLQTVLEGWGAGLRMASLAVRQSDSANSFLESLSGGVQQIQEYLFEEVLARIEDTMLRYLVSGALANRFSADLLDVLASGLAEDEHSCGGRAFIENAVHNNMFIVSLDSEGEWYRHHNLFRELLVQKGTTRFGEARITHAIVAASEWLDKNGCQEDAIRILVDRGLYTQAALIVERHRADLLNEDQWLILDSWVQHFPLDQSRNLPPVLLARASMAAFRLDISRIDNLVRQLDGLHAQHSLTASQWSELAFFRALPLFWSGDIKSAKQALELSDTGSIGCRQIEGEVQVYLAMARAMIGEAALALEELQNRETSNIGRRDTLVSRLTAARSYVSYITLDSDHAIQSAESLISMGEDELDSKHVQGWGHYMRALVLLHTGRYESALLTARKGLECRNHVERRLATELLLSCGLSASHLKDEVAVNNALAGLQALIDNTKETSTDWVQAHSAIARIHLLRGEIDQALKIGRDLPQHSGAGTLVFWLEEPAITRVKIQLLSECSAVSKIVLSELSQLLQKAREQRLFNWMIEVLLLNAIACFFSGKKAEAGVNLHEAVELAAPAGWAGPFIELSQVLKKMVLELTLQEEEAAFLKQLLGIANGSGYRRYPEAIIENSGHDVEDLRAAFTNRELDILELLAERYRNKEIATRLYISTHTVNYHLKHIYQKLDVSSRRMAVIRAGELGILSSTT